jgi:prevent-host-death family protein
MADPVFSSDVHPITDFKTKSSSIVGQARRTGRPVLITQRGRGVAVVVALEEYERMKEELAFGRAVDEGAEQAKRGEFASEAEVEAVLNPKRRR